MDANNLQQILAFALANKLHRATPAEAQGWCGAEGELYIAENDDTTVIVDVMPSAIHIEVHNWCDQTEAVELPHTALNLPVEVLL